MSTQQKQGFFSKFANLVVAGGLGAVGLGALQWAFQQKLPKELLHHVPTLWTFESKITLIASLAAWLAVLLLAHTLLVIFFRILLGTNNPALREDPALLKILGKSQTNTVEQILIFLPILAHWILSHSVEANRHEAVLLTALFIVGRLLFVVGYVFGSAIGLPTLRTAGFILTVGPSAILVLRIVGQKIL